MTFKRLFICLLFLLFIALVSCDNGEIKDGETFKVNINESEFVAKKIGNEEDYYKVIYVSPTGSDTNDGSFDKPLKTFDGARIMATSLSVNMDKDICVVFRGGTYKNTSTTFTSEDSGKNGHTIIYRSYPGEEAIISGGIRVSSWTKEGNLYYTTVKASTIRELFVNGDKVTLARNPNGIDYSQLVNFDKNRRTTIAKEEDLKGATKFEAVLYFEWSEQIARVKSVTKVSNGMKLNYRDAENAIIYDRSYTSPPQAIPDMYVYYQNAMEFLDNPGEFYYNSETQRLYYYPREIDDLKTAEVIIPAQETLVSFKGSKKGYVENVTLDRLTFAYNADYTVYRQGFSEIQAAHYYAYTNNVFTKYCDVIGAAVEMNYSKDINITNSKFTLTSSGGVLFNTYCENSNVKGCLFYKTASYGVMISPDVSAQINASFFHLPNSEPVCHDINIKNNYFLYTGLTYTRSPAITNIHGYNINITHNEIGYSSYTGISCGWGWSLIEYHAKNNHIEYNDVHHYGLFGSDLGGIYTLNNQPNSTVSYNYIHEAANTMMAYYSGSCYNPIYLDEGSNNMNVLYNQIAYCGCSSMKVMYHVTGSNITEIGTNGLEYGDTLNQAIVDASGVEEGRNIFTPYEVNLKTVTSKYTLLGKKSSEETDIYGYRFDVSSPITITSLGRIYVIGNYQKHKITIYNSDKKEIASTVVDMSNGLPDQYGYKYAELNKKITLEKGTYYIVSQEYAGGDTYALGSTRIVSDIVKVNGFVKTEKLVSVKSANTGFVGLNMVIE